VIGEVRLDAAVESAIAVHLLRECSETLFVTITPHDGARPSRGIPAAEDRLPLDLPVKRLRSEERQFKTVLIGVPFFVV
jgi:hypothetical protein